MEREAPAERALVDVGRSIYEARREAGLSQRALAERCGIDQGSISRPSGASCRASRSAGCAD
jgi:ribosome-binding protein aMBF1 (putative translation factor)